MDLQIDAETIIEQAAARLADEAYDNVNALEMLENEISRRIDKFLNEKASTIMEESLWKQIDDLMVRKFRRVNTWGVSDRRRDNTAGRTSTPGGRVLGCECRQ